MKPVKAKAMVEFVELHDTGDKYFVEALKIYVDAFPPNERHSLSLIKERVTAGRNRLWVGLLNDEIGFMALLWPLKGTDFIVLDYMATKSDYRGKGIATDFMRQMGTELRKKNQSFILEVEDEQHGPNVAQRKRRKSFYRKTGARELKDVKYLLPPLQSPDPTDMNLMIFPDYEFETIGTVKVKSLIVQMYQELYGRDANDPFLKSIIDSLTDPIALI